MDAALERQAVLPDLNDQIVAARLAKRQLEEARQLEALADSLPALEAEQRRRERHALLKPAIERSEAEARRTLEAAAPKMTAWREAWGKAHSELIRLAAELPGLQEEIHAAARYAATAAGYRAELAGQPVDPASDLPHALAAGADFGEVWAKVGGTARALQALPDEENAKQRQLLRVLSNGTVLPYEPAIGAKLVGRGNFAWAR